MVTQRGTVCVVESDPTVVIGTVGDAAPHVYLGVQNLILLRIVFGSPPNRAEVVRYLDVPAPVPHVRLDYLAVQVGVSEPFSTGRRLPAVGHHLGVVAQ
jgi:hypothetical protein